jgi:hypothetical protein
MSAHSSPVTASRSVWKTARTCSCACSGETALALRHALDEVVERHALRLAGLGALERRAQLVRELRGEVVDLPARDAFGEGGQDRLGRRPRGVAIHGGAVSHARQELLRRERLGGRRFNRGRGYRCWTTDSTLPAGSVNQAM